MRTASSSFSARLAARSSPSRSEEYRARLGELWRDHRAERAEGAPTVVSTFAGCGGSSLGYSAAGFRELAATDNSPIAGDAFKRNFPEVPFILGDVAGLGAGDLLSSCGVAEGELDLLDGSPPCQGFSMAGNRQLEDPRNALFLEFSRLLGALRPRMMLMENVSGMVKGRMKLVFREIAEELEGAGYRVRTFLANAVRFGVPQSRERVFFVGVRDDLGETPDLPGPTHLGRPLTLRDALDTEPATLVFTNPKDRGVQIELDRPSFVLKSEGLCYAAKGEVVGIYTDGFRAGEPIPADEPAATLMEYGIGSVASHQAQIAAGSDRASYIPAPPLSGKALKVARAMRPGGSGQEVTGKGWFTWLRGRHSEPQPTVTAYGKQYVHPETARNFSIGEVMRIQSFPDEFDLGALPWRKAWSLVGNSVPPLMMEGIARQVAAQLGRLPA